MVMITEYFDQSLVMLKRIFCWYASRAVQFHPNGGLVRSNSFGPFARTPPVAHVLTMSLPKS